MKKLLILAAAMLMAVSLAACGGQPADSGPPQSSTPDTPDPSISQEQEPETPDPSQDITSGAPDESGDTQEEPDMTEEISIKITVGDTELTAVLENNSTTQALLEQIPMTLSMMDLYGREMCYRYGANALPTDDLRSDGYEVGDIAYWPPAGSLVILYEQNGEQFQRQHIGHISEGVEVFSTTGDAEVTFELLDE